MFASANELAQRGLDLLSMRGMGDYALEHTEEDHWIWWHSEGSWVARHSSVAEMKLSVGDVRITVTDPDGRVVPPQVVVPRHHRAFRFFRTAQLTDDLHDAFRNMYLAFELLLSTRVPKRRNERESRWLDRALQEVSSDLALDSLLGTVGATPGNLSQMLRLGARLPLFHARDGESFYIPQESPEERKSVGKALTTVTAIVLRMADQWYDARYPRSFVALGWVHDGLANSLASATFLATDDGSPRDVSESDLLHPRFAGAFPMTHVVAKCAHPSNPVQVLATLSVATLPGRFVLRAIDVVSPSTPLLTTLLEDQLMPTGLERVELLLTARGVNQRQPRTAFRR